MTKHFLRRLGFLFLVIFLVGCQTTSSYLNETYSNAKKNYKRKNYEDASKSYEQFIKDNPQSSMSEVAMYYLADCYRQLGKMDEAKKTYQKIIDKYQSGFWVNSAKKDLKNLM